MNHHPFVARVPPVIKMSFSGLIGFPEHAAGLLLSLTVVGVSRGPGTACPGITVSTLHARN
jgi:hypothetical protein